MIFVQEQNFIWTHAGISNSWIQFLLNKDAELKEEINSNQLSRLINKLFIEHRWSLLCSLGKAKGGIHIGGPIRADISELRTDFLDGVVQIVGHNRTKEIEKYGSNESGIIFCDCLNSSLEFLELDVYSRATQILQL